MNFMFKQNKTTKILEIRREKWFEGQGMNWRKEIRDRLDQNTCEYMKLPINKNIQNISDQVNGVIYGQHK